MTKIGNLQSRNYDQSLRNARLTLRLHLRHVIKPKVLIGNIRHQTLPSDPGLDPTSIHRPIDRDIPDRDVRDASEQALVLTERTDAHPVRVMSDVSVLNEDVGSPALDGYGIVTVRDGETVDQNAVRPANMMSSRTISSSALQPVKIVNLLDIKPIGIEGEPSASKRIDDSILDRKVGPADSHVPASPKAKTGETRQALKAPATDGLTRRWAF